MNESVNMTYSKAVEVASNPETIDQAKNLFSSMDTVFAFVVLVPIAGLLGVSFIWSISEEHKARKLWNNSNFWLSIVFLAILNVSLLVLIPYLFIWLV